MNEGKPQLGRDPRIYQITVLGSLLLYGLSVLHFEQSPLKISLILLLTIATQFLCSKIVRLPQVDLRSALISALSLCLLLRTGSIAVLLTASIITIASKFVLRWNGKHIFNPTNFGIALVIAISGGAWISPGQWGNAVVLAFLVACLGMLVVHRSARSDVTIAFLAAHAGFLCYRAFRLGDPLTIPLHQLSNGALLIFAFFMISDPKTTPNARSARILFACAVAGLAHYIRFTYFTPNALLYSLVLLSAVVPLLDLLIPGERYSWSRPATGKLLSPPKKKGSTYEANAVAYP